MSSGTSRAERCGIDNCRSRRYRVDDDGWVYCSNGHQHHRSLERPDDDDDFGTLGQTTRRKAEKEEKAAKQLSGRQGLELYLYCYQVLLWKQSHWLVNTKGLPLKLEEVVRDLWALRLQKLKNKVEIASDTESQSQLFSSQSEGETDTEHEESRRVRRGRKTDNSPKLIDSLVLCYFGMLLLRLPVSLSDLYQWAASGEMIYYKARESVPLEMRERLPSTYHAALEPTAVLKPEDLQTAVLDLAIGYHRDFGMPIPPLNYPLVLFRYLKDLALPLEVYPTVLRLARLVSCTFAFPDFSARRRLRLSDLPEAQLATLLVVAVKLFYPFDELERHPVSMTDTGVMAIDWHAWVKAATGFDSASKIPGRLNFEESLKVTDKDVLSMNDTQLDDYLNWYEGMWVEQEAENESKISDFRRMLFKMFPTGPSDPQKAAPPASRPDEEALSAAKEERLKTVQGALRATEVVPEDDSDAEDSRRPGSFYKRYRKPEDLEGAPKAFYEAVAKQAGMSLKTLVKGVFLFERKMERWVDMERRSEAGLVDDEMDVENEEDMATS